uniref:uncharacterized protein LOC120334756 isoform X1 n=1 Tax=Styela clava TaxID=7725 RepID=UPI001939EE99|nr:uncharacterized protein LOC120334756 isoform X1 [Styela clava]
MDEDESSFSFAEDPSLTIPKTLYDVREFGESRHAVSRARRHGRTMVLSNLDQSFIPTFDSAIQTSLVFKRDRMNQTDKIQMDDTETETDKTDTRDRNLQTDHYNQHMDTQTMPDISVRESSMGLPFTNVYVQTDEKRSYDNDTQTNILQQTNTPTQTLVKVYQENEFQTEPLETIDPSQTEMTGSNLEPVIEEGFRTLSQNSQQGGDSALALMGMFEKESKIENAEQIDNEYLVLVKIAWKIIWQNIALRICESHAAGKNKITAAFANTLIVLLANYLQSGNIEEQFGRFSSRCDEVIQTGDLFRTAKKDVHAITAYYAAAKLHQFKNSGDQSLRGITTCVRQIVIVVQSLANQEQNIEIIKDHMIPLMHEIMKLHQSIQCSSHKVKVMAEANCWYNIGICYCYGGENGKFAQITQTAIELIKTEFGDESQTYKVYACGMNNAGIAHWGMGNKRKAVELFKLALEAYFKVQDWDDEEEKNRIIELTRAYLESIESDSNSD